jgi:hypothetical protein
MLEAKLSFYVQILHRVYNSSMPDSPIGRKTVVGLIIILAGLAVLLALPRFIAPGRFVTADEPSWGKRSANFFYAISHGDYASTYQSGHPGVTTYWIGSAAYKLRFPKYSRVGQTSLGDTKLLELFRRHGPPLIQVLSTARTIQAAVIIFTLLVSFFYASSVFNFWYALPGFFIIALDPFHIAHSRVFHTNGLISSFLFLALLSYLFFLKENRWHGLIVSSIATSLAILTVTQGLIFLPVIGLITFLEFWMHRSSLEEPWLRNASKKYLFPFIFWIALIGVVFFLLWPAMWVSPLDSIAYLFNDTFKATVGVINVSENAQGSSSTNPVLFYIKAFLWRSTILVWIGCSLTLFYILRKNPPSLVRAQRKNVIYLILFVIIFTLVMSLGAKKYDRYLLPVFPPLDLIAGIGWIVAADWLNTRFFNLQSNLMRYGTIAILLFVQLMVIIPHHPYYLTYFNPILGSPEEVIRDNMDTGWGEGLSEAAIYLRQKPEIQDNRVIAWFPLAFNWYSASLGFTADPIYLDNEISDWRLKDYLSADYAVIYINQWQRNYPKKLMDHLENLSPEHTVSINGIDYVRIYNLNK